MLKSGDSLTGASAYGKKVCHPNDVREIKSKKPPKVPRMITPGGHTGKISRYEYR